MRKIAISLPDHQAEAIERIRRRRGVPRSRVIQQALELYLASEQAREEAERAYEAGYRAIPEDPADARSYARATAAVLGHEDWT
jgi:metal-responsive CopG/Arc/MetJ family transcriptional regulator